MRIEVSEYLEEDETSILYGVRVCAPLPVAFSECFLHTVAASPDSS
jgi:hypothetical protein